MSTPHLLRCRRSAMLCERWLASSARTIGCDAPPMHPRSSVEVLPGHATYKELTTPYSCAMAVIEARGLIKRYGDLTAVDGVTFNVEQGEIFGMLGPNGAGKTTTLEMLEGLRNPDGGSATVLGYDAIKESRQIHSRIGVQLQSTALPPFTNVREAIDLFASMYPSARPTEELINEFDLAEKANTYAINLSGGQMQRLSIALALVNEPDLIFLD